MHIQTCLGREDSFWFMAWACHCQETRLWVWDKAAHSSRKTIQQQDNREGRVRPGWGTVLPRQALWSVSPTISHLLTFWALHMLSDYRSINRLIRLRSENTCNPITLKLNFRYRSLWRTFMFQSQYLTIKIRMVTSWIWPTWCAIRKGGEKKRTDSKEFLIQWYSVYM